MDELVISHFIAQMRNKGATLDTAQLLVSKILHAHNAHMKYCLIQVNKGYLRIHYESDNAIIFRLTENGKNFVSFHLL